MIPKKPCQRKEITAAPRGAACPPLWTSRNGNLATEFGWDEADLTAVPPFTRRGP
jgi:hypothetical protein